MIRPTAIFLPEAPARPCACLGVCVVAGLAATSKPDDQGPTAEPGQRDGDDDDATAAGAQSTRDAGVFQTAPSPTPPSGTFL